jgi:hypothetical protein
MKNKRDYGSSWTIIPFTHTHPFHTQHLRHNCFWKVSRCSTNNSFKQIPTSKTNHQPTNQEISFLYGYSKFITVFRTTCLENNYTERKEAFVIFNIVSSIQLTVPHAVLFLALNTPEWRSGTFFQWIFEVLTQCWTRIGQNFGIYYKHFP